MAKIYSRKRIHIHKIKNKKLVKFLTIWIIAISTVALIYKSFTPMLEALCVKEAKSVATDILNDESTKVIKDIDYNDLINVSKDKNDNITMVKSNVVLINILASDIAYNVQQELNNKEKTSIKFPIGSLTGSKIFSGFGPNITIKVIPRGNVLTDFKSEFVSAGINQTIHRLYLNVVCEVSIITPYSNIDTEILNQVLFAENIIVGTIPDSYYNLEGITQDDYLDGIQ